MIRELALGYEIVYNLFEVNKMKVIGVQLLHKAELPEDEANRLKAIIKGYESTVQLKLGNEILDVTSQDDLNKLMAQKLLSLVHTEFVKHGWCY